MHKKINSIIGLAIIAAIVLAANLIGTLVFQRAKFDMTGENLFTLSDGSKNIARSLDEEVSAKLFYSKTVLSKDAFLKGYANRIIGMLEEYRGLSGGKMTLEVIDPRPDTDEEEAAERYGLQAVQADPTASPAYLGLVLRDESDHETSIPFFHPRNEATLEYDISKALSSIANPAKKRVGIISALPVMGSAPPQQNPMMPPQQQQGARPWQFVQQLRASCRVTDLGADMASVPGDIDLLLLVHPKALPPTTLYAIDQYVLAGGKVLAFVDALCEADQRSMAQMAGNNMQMMMQASFDSNIPELLSSWGVEMVSADAPPAMGMGGPPSGPAPKLAADANLAASVQTGRGGAVEKVVTWLQLSDKNVNQDEIVTEGLENLLLVNPGVLRKTTSSDDIEVVNLLETTDQATTMDGMMMKFGIDPAKMLRDFEAGDEKLALACKITGRFKSAFPSGKPVMPDVEDAEESDDSDEDAHLGESTEEATIVIVTDVDMISDDYSVRVMNFFGREMAQPLNDNLAFLHNTVENLTGSQDLISLRSRGRSQRPFTRVEEIQRNAQAEWREKEKELDEDLQEANQRWRELQQATSERQILTAALKAEKDKLRKKRIETRAELRDVRRSLREDVERLGFILKFVNIALMPILVILVSLAVAALRILRRRHAA